MIKKTFLALLISSTIYAAGNTTTTTSFTDVEPTEDSGVDRGKGDHNKSFFDKHGNVVSHQIVEIKTENFKVNNFWNKFSFYGDGQSDVNFDTIAKSGIVRTSIEATSICNLYPELDSKGCSGQKPFLINDEALSGVSVGETISLTFSKDYNSTDTTSSSDLRYNIENNVSFYPLDIGRGPEYYKPKDGEDASTCTSFSFFCMMSSMFDAFFGTFFDSFFNFGVQSSSDVNDTNIEDIRQKYIANITAGIDQDHLMERNVTAFNQTKNTHDPVSLIDYIQTTASSGSCSLFIFTFSEDNSFCNLMSGMPFMSFFASSTSSQTYTVDTIQADTENAIISFAGQYAELNVTTYESGSAAQMQADIDASTTPSLPFPIAMMKNMMCMFMPFISCDTAADPTTEEISRVKDSYYAFNEENATTLTMAVTNDGNKIDGFQTFKLLGIHSIVGDGNISSGGSCTVTKTHKKLICFSNCTVVDWTNTFTSENPNNPTVQDELDTNSYSDWLNWCSTETSATDWKTVGFISTLYTYTNDAYTEGNSTPNTSGRVLTLDLQMVDLNATSSSAKLRYKLLKTN